MLRTYQIESIQASMDAFKRGLQRICVSLPVGSGKTVVFANLIGKLEKPKPLATKTLVLAHRKELLYQSYNQIKRFNTDLKLSIDMGSTKRVQDPNVDVLLGSVATLGRVGTSRMDHPCYDPDFFKAVIIDEAHHASAASYQRILNNLGVYDERGKHIKVVGFSATLRRHDGLSLQPTFQEIVFHKPVAEMISADYLCDVRVMTVKTKLVLDSVKIDGRAGDFNIRALSSKVNSHERNQIIFETYKEQRELHSRKSCLIFAVDVQHIQDLASTFREGGVQVQTIHAKTDSRQREEIIEDFKQGKEQVVINCGILTEGVDIPNIDMIIMARPTRSGVLLQQMLGRGMRKCAGKEYCLVLDFVDVVDQRMMLATIPTLLGLDSLHTLKNESMKRLLAECAQDGEEKDSVASVDSVDSDVSDDSLESFGESMSVEVTLQPFLDPFSVASISRDSTFLRKYSELAWTRCGPEKFVLSIYSGTYAKLELDKSSKLWHGSLKQILKSSKGQFHQSLFTSHARSGERVPVEFTHDNFQDAIKSLDNLVKIKFGFKTYTRLRVDAAWRKNSITHSQARFLQQKMGISPSPKNANVLPLPFSKPEICLNKGSASDLISRKVFGAGGAQGKEKSEIAKLKKKEEWMKKQHRW